MPFEEVKFEFPHEAKAEKEDTFIDIEPSSAETLNVEKPKKATAEDDFEIEVVDDTPEEDRGRKPAPPPDELTDEELQSYTQSVQQRIKHFSKGYHDERRAKEEALRERQALEAYAKKLYEENNRLKGETTKSKAAVVEQAKRTVADQIEKAREAYRQAYEIGDSDKLLKAEEELAEARERKRKLDAIKLDNLQNPKNSVQSEEAAFKPPAELAPKPAQKDEKAENWAKENTWFGTDDEMTSFALGLHNKLVKGGYDPKSDAYYAEINSRMREVFPSHFGVTETKTASNVVAPATRSRAPKKIRLTKSQVAIAKRLGVPLDTYAKQVAEEMRKTQNG